MLTFYENEENLFTSSFRPVVHDTLRLFEFLHGAFNLFIEYLEKVIHLDGMLLTLKVQILFYK